MSKIQQSIKNDESCIMNHDESFMIDTAPGVFFQPSQEDLFEMARLYESCIGIPLNAGSASVLECWFEKMEPALIREAIRRTGIHARRPCVSYVNAILRNWDRQGIHDMAAMFKQEEKRSYSRQHRQSMKDSWWQPSTTRHYTPEESEKDYFDLEAFFSRESSV